jgi:hypothetical protein
VTEHYDLSRSLGLAPHCAGHLGEAAPTRAVRHVAAQEARILARIAPNELRDLIGRP